MKPIYREGYLGKTLIDSLKEEVLNLEWETKRTARHEYFMSERDTEYSYGRQDDTINSLKKELEEKKKMMLANMDLLDHIPDNVLLLGRSKDDYLIRKEKREEERRAGHWTAGTGIVSGFFHSPYIGEWQGSLNDKYEQ